MNPCETIFGYVNLIFAMTFFSFIGYFSTFKTNEMMRFYVKFYQKRYLKSMKMTFFLSRYYQAFAKYNYGYYKRLSQRKWFYYNLKICGVFCFLFTLLLLIITIHRITGAKLGLFTD